MRVLVAYDISDNFRRQRFAEWLLARGFSRIQRSVYVARGGIALARDVERMARRVVDRERDVIHIILVQDLEWDRRIVVGVEGRDEDRNIRV